jgi:hypothetical protein
MSSRPSGKACRPDPKRVTDFATFFAFPFDHRCARSLLDRLDWGRLRLRDLGLEGYDCAALWRARNRKEPPLWRVSSASLQS